MKNRYDCLARLGRVQRQMRDLERWRLTAAVLTAESVAATHRAMTESIGEGMAAFGPPAAAALRHVHLIEAKAKSLAQLCDAQRRRVLVHSSRSALADRLLDDQGARDLADRERQDLVEVIESWLGGFASSPGQD